MDDLHKSCTTGDIEYTRLLLDNGVDIEVKDRYGLTPLHYASMQYASLQRHLIIVKLLLDHGANIEAKSSFNYTCLHHASRNGQTDIVKLLLDRGANTQVKNYHGYTAKQVARHPFIKALFECHEHIIGLKEWRPWNHPEYPKRYRNTMKTLLILAKGQTETSCLFNYVVRFPTICKVYYYDSKLGSQ